MFFYPTATMGKVTVMVPSDVATLFATAIALLNSVGFTSSKEKTVGSVLVLVQVIVAGPPEVRLPGMPPKVKAETKGRKKIMMLAKREVSKKVFKQSETAEPEDRTHCGE